MLACKHCSTPNSLDSTFCKKCGTAVPLDQKREASLQLDKLVDEGLAALNAGRTSEALAIADSAIATDPTHLGALHLKSAVHERRGEIADALESAERIVELNPDSELDRIKRNGLREGLLNASIPVQPDRRVAFAAAAAAMVLVACGGILLARKSPAAPAVVASNSSGRETVVETPVVVPPTQAANVPQTNVAPATNQVSAGSDVAATTDSTARRATAVTEPSNSNFGPLPNTADGGIGNQSPIVPNFPEATRPTVTTSKPPAALTRSVPQSPEPETIRPNEAKQDDGQIDISVSRPGRRTGGSETVPETHTNGAVAYARVGTERFELGDYAGAAANLEKAVSGGGDPVELNRRLAQAYSRLGRNGEAASAYERCRAAADAALKSGKGDKDRLQAARDAAEAGLRTVKGG